MDLLAIANIARPDTAVDLALAMDRAQTDGAGVYLYVRRADDSARLGSLLISWQAS